MSNNTIDNILIVLFVMIVLCCHLSIFLEGILFLILLIIVNKKFGCSTSLIVLLISLLLALR